MAKQNVPQYESPTLRLQNEKMKCFYANMAAIKQIQLDMLKQRQGV